MIGRLRRDQQGASAVEFGLLIFPLLAIIMGSVEYGYRLYAQSIVTGTLRTAARMASTGQYTAAQIDARVKQRLHAFHPPQSGQENVRIVIKSYTDFTGVGAPEPVVSGTVASGTYCFNDVNRNGVYDEDSGVTGMGQPEDVIHYEASLDYPRLLPVSFTQMNPAATVRVSANVLISNEPFAARNIVPPQKLCVTP